jgi:hypothetical protein
MPRGEWIVDAHREGKRFVVRADEKLTAFVELEAAIRKNSSTLSIYACSGFRTVSLGQKAATQSGQ